MEPDVVIATRGLVKSLGGVRVLDGVDVEVTAGELCGVVGADGAGKTSLLRCVAGLYRPDQGSVTPGRRGRDRMGLCPQGFHIYADLTVDENIDFFGSAFGLERDVMASRREELLGFVDLTEHRHRLAGDLSGGMQQKLTLVCAIVHDPPVLLLDEPTTGVDPVSRREFWRLLEVMHAAGTTILLASAYFDEVERCQHVLFLHEGRVIADGSVNELVSSGSSLEDAFRARMAEAGPPPTAARVS